MFLMDNIAFIAGSGRSGTTWLQLMLGSHPAVATAQESQLFNNYLSKLVRQWEAELRYPETSELRFHGISSYIDTAEFYQLLRQFAEGVYAPILAQKASAKLFLEKSPNNSLHLPVIQACFPKAKIIHVIRDGRDVASSILAARKDWGKYWSHRGIEDAALEWKTAVNTSRAACISSSSYLEVKYEDLLENGYSKLEEIFSFLSIPSTEEEIKAIYDAHTFDKLKSNKYDKKTFINPGERVASGTEERPEPTNFFRKGVSGSWKTELSMQQLAEFNWVAGDLLHELGYAENAIANVKKPFSLSLKHAYRYLRSGFGKKIKTILRLSS